MFAQLARYLALAAVLMVVAETPMGGKFRGNSRNTSSPVCSGDLSSPC